MTEVEAKGALATKIPKENDDALGEEEDEDYNPLDDVLSDEHDEGLERAVGEHDGLGNMIPSMHSITLSEAKRKAVDDAFLQMFGYNFGTRFLPKRQRRNGPLGAGAATAMDATHDLLVRIFGPTAAAQIAATTSTTIQVHRTQIRREPLPTFTTQTVTEVKRYAGTTVQVKRRVNDYHSSDDTVKMTLPADETKKPRGLDVLLQDLEGPGKLSTVAKTSADWDSFKQDAGVEGEIEKQAQGKNAFLIKQDFLQRVDQRAFVQEKAKRDLERSKRGK